MTSFTGLTPNNPSRYLGPNVAINTVVTRNRSPTGADYRMPETGKLYPFNTFWLVGKDPTTGIQGDLWYLSKIAANIAYWIQLSANTNTGIFGVNVDAFTPPGTNPVLPDSNNLITVTGGQVAAGGVGTNVIRTDSLAANTFTIEIQRSQAVASSTVEDNGVSHFDSSSFSVDSNAFVSLSTSFYSTGTWVPVLEFGNATTGITYSLQKGQYTRVGNLLFYEYQIILTSKGSATGLASVSGLPIDAGTTLPDYQTPGSCSACIFDVGASNFQNIVIASTSILLLYQTTPLVSQQLADTNFGNGSAFGGEGFYFLT